MKRLLFVAFVFLLTACGGGGGSVAPPLSNGSAQIPAGANSGAAIAAHYTLTDLGTGLPGSPGLVPHAVNNSGVVVGNASEPILASLPSCSPSTCGPGGAWIFRNGALKGLPPLSGDSLSIVNDINDAGTIAGGSVGATTETAVLWNPDLSLVTLGTGIAPSNSGAEAIGISNSGKVVGVSFNASTGVPLLTTAFASGAATNPCGSDVKGVLWAVNDAGLAAGQQRLPTGAVAAITCPPLSTIETPATSSGVDFAYDINNSGAVVGRLNTGTTNASFHPFLFQNGTTTDLGTLFPGNSSAVGAAFGINSEGVIVGFSAAGGAVIGPPPVLPINPRAFVYAGGTMVDLNTRLPASCANWTLVLAKDINDRGQIVGVAWVGGFPSGVEHGFLLTPAP